MQDLYKNKRHSSPPQYVNDDWCVDVTDPWIITNKERLEQVFCDIQNRVVDTLGEEAGKCMHICVFSRYQAALASMSKQ